MGAGVLTRPPVTFPASGAADSCTIADPEALKKVLLYHVLGSIVSSEDIVGMGGSGTPETANGAKLNVTTIDGAVYVNDAKVITADVPADNGVIHIIDTVLIPPDMR